VFGRGATRVVVVMILAGIVVLGFVSLATASPVGPGTGCAQNLYGTQCVVLSVHAKQVTGLGAQLTWVPDELNGRTWTFVTTAYACDPRGHTRLECAPRRTVYGSVQPPTPHRTADQDCTIAGDAVPYGDCHGAFNVALPVTFAGARWLCEEWAVRVGAKWGTNGSGIPQGTRACRSIS